MTGAEAFGSSPQPNFNMISMVILKYSDMVGCTTEQGATVSALEAAAVGLQEQVSSTVFVSPAENNGAYLGVMGVEAQDLEKTLCLTAVAADAAVLERMLASGVLAARMSASIPHTSPAVAWGHLERQEGTDVTKAVMEHILQTRSKAWDIPINLAELPPAQKEKVL